MTDPGNAIPPAIESDMIGNNLKIPLAGAASIERIVVLVVPMTDERIGFESGSRLHEKIAVFGDHVDVTAQVHEGVLIMTPVTDLGVGAGVRPGYQLNVPVGGHPDVAGEVSRSRVSAVADLGGGVISAVTTRKSDATVERSELDLVGPANPVEITEIVVPASGRHLRSGKAREELTAAGADEDVSGVIAVGIPRPAVADEGHGPVAVPTRHADVPGGTNRYIPKIRPGGTASTMTDHREGVVLRTRVERNVTGASSKGNVPLVPIDQVASVWVVAVPSSVAQHGISLILVSVFQRNPEVCGTGVTRKRVLGVGRRSLTGIDILIEGNR